MNEEKIKHEFQELVPSLSDDMRGAIGNWWIHKINIAIKMETERAVKAAENLQPENSLIAKDAELNQTYRQALRDFIKLYK